MLRMFNIGECIGGYLEVIDLLGMGGQYLAAKAQDVRDGTIVVVRKLLVGPGEKDYRQHAGRAKREGHIRIGHPGVADPIAAWQEDGEWLIVTPYIEGQGLDVVLHRCGGRMAVQQAHPLVAQVADALGAIHRKGVFHRDIKLDNIRIRPDGSPVLIDFGIANTPDGMTLTLCGQILGSPESMSPEQVLDAHEVDQRADLYSLGTVAYRLLTGQLTVKSGSPKEVLLSIPQYVPPSPRAIVPSIPAHLDYAVMRLLAKDREERFRTAEEFLGIWNAGTGDAASMGFCSSCGTSLDPGARFCPSCGAEARAGGPGTTHCLACGATVGETPACAVCQRSFSRPNHRLLFSGGTMRGQTFRIPQGTYDVGREQLCPRDGHISRRHLRIVCSNGHVTVQDLGSANKTYVAGVPADHPIPLTPGVEILIAGNLAGYSTNQ